MWRRMTALVAGVAIVAASLSAAFIFAGTGSTRDVAASSRDLHWANTTAATLSTMRAAAAQALIFGVDRELGVAGDEAVALAIEELERQVAATETQLDDPAGTRVLGDAALGDAIHMAVAEAEAVAELVVARDALGADAHFSEVFDPGYMAASSRLDMAQQGLADDIAGAETLAGRVEAGTRLLITLLIPVLAILIYRRLAQRELRNRRLKMSARLEAERELSRAKDDFIAGISHELRTPLTSIYGFSEYLLDRGLIDPSEAIELIGLINNESADLSRMVEDLLTAARLDADTMAFAIEPVNIKDEVVAVVAPMQRGGHDIRVIGNDVVAECDRARLRQITRNLVSNALKHGGQRIEITIAADGDAATLTVSDNGPGISPEMQERLFERFAHDGSESLLIGSVGLGLAIGRTLAQKMGGDVVFDADHIWTTFTCSLPLATEGAIVAAAEASDGPLGFAPESDPDADFKNLFGEAPGDEEDDFADRIYAQRITFDRG